MLAEGTAGVAFCPEERYDIYNTTRLHSSINHAFVEVKCFFSSSSSQKQASLALALLLFYSCFFSLQY